MKEFFSIFPLVGKLLMCVCMCNFVHKITVWTEDIPKQSS